jgi:hypothetical protein
MNGVYIYGNLTINSSLNTHFFFCLLYSPVGVTLVRLKQESAKIFGHFFVLHYSPILKIF